MLLLEVTPNPGKGPPSSLLLSALASRVLFPGHTACQHPAWLPALRSTWQLPKMQVTKSIITPTLQLFGSSLNMVGASCSSQVCCGQPELHGFCAWIQCMDSTLREVPPLVMTAALGQVPFSDPLVSPQSVPPSHCHLRDRKNRVECEPGV